MPDVRAPEVCKTCHGEGFNRSRVWPHPRVPCPDCCCPCGTVTGDGGLCERCDADSFDEQDLIAVRRADR